MSDIEKNVVPLELRLDLRFQSAVEAILVDLFVLDKFVGGNLCSELLGREEKVLYPVTFLAARRAAGRRD